MDKTGIFFRIILPLLAVAGFAALCVILGFFVHPILAASLAGAGIVGTSIWFFTSGKK